MGGKHKHLEMIQAVINRMASNSFVFKGWSITIIAGISAFAAQGTSLGLLLIPVGATLLFWAVDAYCLMLERAFRDLYKYVAKRPNSRIDFLMNVENVGFKSWLSTLFTRPVLVAFYGVILLLLGVLFVILMEASINEAISCGS